MNNLQPPSKHAARTARRNYLILCLVATLVMTVLVTAVVVVVDA